VTTQDFAHLPGDGAPVLLFGGTFDPVHRAHTELGFWARDRVCPGAWLVFVPAAISPHKSERPTPGRHRVEMLRLACRGRSRWWVWTEELRRAATSDEPSYWVDTLEAAKSGDELRFIIGSDQALAFHRWHRWQDILTLARPVVIARGPIDSASRLREAMAESGWPRQHAESFLERATLLDTPIMDVNATLIRAQLAAGGSGPIDGLDHAVQRYAVKHGLYTRG